MNAYIERSFSEGKPEDRTASYVAVYNGTVGVIFIDWDGEWAFKGGNYYIGCNGRDMICLEPTTIDSDLYAKANPKDFEEFVQHIAREVAHSIWESTGKDNSTFDLQQIIHIAEIRANELIKK